MTQHLHPISCVGDFSVAPFYGPEFPIGGQVVIVRVSPTNPHDANGFVQDDIPGVTVELLEYSNLPAFIPLEELSFKRKKGLPILKDYQVGKIFAARVIKLQVKEANGSFAVFIDMSKRAIENSTQQAARTKYDTAIRINRILEECAERSRGDEHPISFAQLVKQVSWPLYASSTSPLTALRAMAYNADDKSYSELELSSSHSQHLLDAIRTHLKAEKAPSMRQTVSVASLPNMPSDVETNDGDTHSDPSDAEFDAEVLALLQDGHGKIGSFKDSDVIHTIRVQIVSLRCCSNRSPGDCGPALLRGILTMALRKTQTERNRIPHTSHPKGKKSAKDLVLLAEVKALLSVWGKVIGQLCENDMVTLFPSSCREDVVKGQVELLYALTECCMHASHHEQDGDAQGSCGLRCLLPDIIYLLYDEDVANVLDSESIIQWAECALGGSGQAIDWSKYRGQFEGNGGDDADEDDDTRALRELVWDCHGLLTWLAQED